MKIKRKNLKVIAEELEAEIITNSESAKIKLISQEITFAKILAGNNAYKREKILENFKKWLNLRSKSSFPFTDYDFSRVWKGLFYCMWMSDKPIIQENLANELSSLMHCFHTPEMSIQFYGSFLKSMTIEWFGIDQWRIDKFMMLVRRCTRQSIVVLKRCDWNKNVVDLFCKQLSDTVLNYVKTTAGLIMHFSDIYIEEIAKISEGDISAQAVSLLMRPFITFVAEQSDSRLLYYIINNVFYALITQSDIGREYREKFEIWEKAGFPCNNINDLEITEEYVDNSEDESTEEIIDNDKKVKVLDPRAGNVNVEMPEIEFDAQMIIDMFESYKYKPKTMGLNRKLIKKITDKFEKYLNDEYPLGIQTVPDLNEEALILPDIDSKADELLSFETELSNDNTNFKKLNKKQKRKHIEALKVKSLVQNGTKRKCEDNVSCSEWMEEDNFNNSIDDCSIDNTSGGNFVLLKNQMLKRNVMNGEDADEDDIRLNSDSENSNREDNDELDNIKMNNINSDSEDDVHLDSDISSLSDECVDEEQIKENFMLEPRTLKKLNSTLTKSRNFNCNNEIKTPITKRKSLEIVQTKISQKKIKKNNSDEWNKPLVDGEIEYYIPSNKTRVHEANAAEFKNDLENFVTPKKKMLKNPFAKSNTTPINKLKGKQKKQLLMSQTINGNLTKSTEKRVKIALNKNSSQDNIEYLIQLKSSPHVPYDSEKKPNKSLLKPNLMPSPINPFFMKKNCLNFDGM